ncbi:hypothetical protein, partial [Ectopseudomonas toyotomiensis]|uniref:hypothetical protein n=1 Tax=Ectopseudomonas toyotomiensis TaxID=554344 RepID=UPI0019D4A60F
RPRPGRICATSWASVITPRCLVSTLPLTVLAGGCQLLNQLSHRPLGMWLNLRVWPARPQHRALQRSRVNALQLQLRSQVKPAPRKRLNLPLNLQ